MCARRLVTAALAAGSGDNVTVAVAFARGARTCEAAFVRGGAGDGGSV